jgi:uncharacterized protein YndB with AHSA1/START domain
MNQRGVVILAMVCAIGPSRLPAEVVDSASGGFTVKQTLTIQAAPQEVYRRIFRVGDWWNPQHTFSGDAHNLSIDEKVAGCFCEKLPNGGGVKHMEVVYLAPGKAIVMHGTLGPLQSIAANGSMQIQLSAADGGTKLEVTYAVSGYLAAGMNTWAAPVDSVLKEQFTRLKSFVEHGDPAPK